MPTVSKPSFRARTWESHGAAKSAWEVSFFVIDGQKRRRVLRSGFATKRAAEAAFRDYSKEVMDGDFDKTPTVAAPTLKEFTERYLVEGTAGKQPRSIEIDRLAFHWFMQYVPGDTPLDEVAPHQIDAYVARRLQDKPRIKNGRKTVSESTVRRELMCIRRLFNVAVRWKLIQTNPSDGTVKPNPPEGDVVFLEIEEQRALLAACGEMDAASGSSLGADSRHNSAQDTPYLRPLVALALYTGLRASEMFHLSWSDVDFERNRLTVRNTTHFRTKTRKNRMLELHPALLRELESWKRWYEVEIARARARTNDPALHLQLRRKAQERLSILLRCEPRSDRLIFPSFKSVAPDTGEALPMDNIKKGFSRAVREAGIRRRVGLHTLRHTFAVTLARAGVPLTKVSKALGHGSLRTTQIYLRFTPDEGADVTSRLPDLGAASSPT